jgi:hypothetical protein
VKLVSLVQQAPPTAALAHLEIDDRCFAWQFEDEQAAGRSLRR